MIALPFDTVDAFVTKQQHRGIPVRWDGWTMKFFSPNKKALNHPKGVRVGNEWGFESRIDANSHGYWLVPKSLLNRGTDARR